MLEDLGEDLELLDQAKTGTDLAHARDFVLQLAKLHAHWWESPDIGQCPTSGEDEFWHNFVGLIFKLRWKSFWELVSSEEGQKAVVSMQSGVRT